ncbi:hypothetical protein [Altericista sp. CCNU0014]|uniref:hypothetical protein n=1 Tax=Altericista sp. CCNU0014 TaxID=3082949 RepID=UPI00384B0402
MTPDETQQQKDFAMLLQALKQGSSDEVKSILAERESVAPEDALSAAAIDRVQQRIKEFS